MKCPVCNKHVKMRQDGKPYAHKFSGVDCHGPYVIPLTGNDIIEWTCVCGYTNHNILDNENECSKCGHLRIES